MMTPRQFAARYAQLEVYLFTDEQARASGARALPPGGRWVSVAVNSYRLGLKTAYQRKDHSIDVFKNTVRPHLEKAIKESGGLTVWVRTIAGDVVAKTYRSRAELSENVNDPFYGKGSPEEVQVVLQLAVRFGLFPAEKVQIYCSNGNIGLDCNGFVANYLRHVKQGKAWDTDARSKQEKKREFDGNTMIASIMKFGNQTMAVKTMAELQMRPFDVYLLAMCDASGRMKDHVRNDDGSISYGHIMITEPGTLRAGAAPPVAARAKAGATSMAMIVLESAGGVGLVESTYDFLGDNGKGVFEVLRGSKQERMHVLVSRVV